MHLSGLRLLQRGLSVILHISLHTAAMLGNDLSAFEVLLPLMSKFQLVNLPFLVYLS